MLFSIEMAALFSCRQFIGKQQRRLGLGQRERVVSSELGMNDVRIHIN